MEIIKLVIHKKSRWTGIKKLAKRGDTYIWESCDKKGEFQVLDVGNRAFAFFSIDDMCWTVELPFYEGDI